MKSKSSASLLLVVILILVLPALTGCASNAGVVQATPQNSADLSIPNQDADALAKH